MRIKRKKSKGQAALEFMITYGWAMLLLTAMVAGLAYMMPHPKTMVANKCLFGSGVPCLGSQLNENNLTVVLQNGMGQSIYNISANVTMPMNLACNVSNTTLRAEERLTLTCNSSKMDIKDDARIRIEFKYKKVKDGLDQVIIGELYAKYS